MGDACVFQRHSFLWISGQPEIQAFTITNAKLSTGAPPRKARDSFQLMMDDAQRSRRSRTSNGIVWAVEGGNPAVLHAYSASTLNELYDTDQAGGSRDHFGSGNKFMAPDDRERQGLRGNDEWRGRVQAAALM